MLTITCAYCAKEVQATRKRVNRAAKKNVDGVVCCSSLCGTRLRWKRLGVEGHSNHACEVCGKKFYRSPAHVSRVGHIYCSHACHAIKRTGAGNHAYRGGKVPVVCTQCLRQYRLSKPGELRRAEKHFYSKECALAYRAANPGLGFTVCCRCSASVRIRTTGQIGKRVFCTKECANAAHSEYIAGENNGRYVHGKAKEEYPRDFRKVAPLIRKRDAYQCQMCWISEAINGQALDVHHIDYDKKNNEMGNLISLCRVCHGSMHGRSKRRKSLTRTLSRLVIQPQLRLSASA